MLKMTLMEKLLLLCVTKFAALDAYGMGIEMEGGNPADALNGMPEYLDQWQKLMSFTRMLSYTIDANGIRDRSK